MRSVPWFISLAAIVVVGSVARAQAPVRQFGTAPTPTLSPYLNLARPGPIAVNYYGLVRPQQDFARSLQGLQGQVLVQQQLVEDLQTPGPVVVPTGHQVQFLNYNSYFLTLGNNRPTMSTMHTVVPGLVGGVNAPRYGAGLVPSYGINR